MADRIYNVTIEERRAIARRMAWIHDEQEEIERRDELLDLIQDQTPGVCECGYELARMALGKDDGPE